MGGGGVWESDESCAVRGRERLRLRICDPGPWMPDGGWWILTSSVDSEGLPSVRPSVRLPECGPLARGTRAGAGAKKKKNLPACLSSSQDPKLRESGRTDGRRGTSELARSLVRSEAEQSIENGISLQ